MTKIKNESHFKELCDWCTGVEPKLETVIKEYDYPPLWYRKPDFSTLILTILEQQVSLASAKAAYNKLVEKIKDVTSENLLKLSDEELRACYFSRQKIQYTRILANELVSGNLNLDELNEMDEAAIRKTLIKLKGIGNWTVDMYVMMSLHYSDIFPPGDVATIEAVYALELVTPEATKEEIV